MAVPDEVEEGTCKHCRRRIWKAKRDDAEWQHYPGGIYCRTRNGFTNEHLYVATPMSHPDEGFDEGDYRRFDVEVMVAYFCKGCQTVTMDRSVHDKYCPAKEELR